MAFDHIYRLKVKIVGNWKFSIEREAYIVVKLNITDQIKSIFFIQAFGNGE